MVNSRLVWGWVLMALGLILIVVSPLLMFISLFYGIPIFIIGLVILLNKDEDKIEQINNIKSIKKSKK